jgi:hypothetical protein
MRVLWETVEPLFMFLGGIATLFGGAFGTLVILHYMEDISPAYCIVATTVYGYVAIMTIVVAVNRA